MGIFFQSAHVCRPIMLIGKRHAESKLSVDTISKGNPKGLPLGDALDIGTVMSELV